MPYEREIEQLAKGALAAHGQLQEVVFLEANKDSLLVFADGTVIPVLHQQHGYDIRSEAYAVQLAREHSGTDYFSLLAFGYLGTGPSCYAVFLRTSGFQSTNVEHLSAPLKLRPDGTTLHGTKRDRSIEWADGSATPLPGKATSPKPTSRQTCEMIEISASTLQEARERIKEQIPPGQSVLSETIISDGKEQRLEQTGETAEAAYKKAEEQVPNDAQIVARREIKPARIKSVSTVADDESEAKKNVIQKSGKTDIVQRLTLTEAGRKGFWGIGHKQNLYQAQVLEQALVEVRYKTEAHLVANIGFNNRGTLHDTLSKASGYWMGRISSPRKDPFVMYVFQAGEDARAALLELPCIHETADGSLICTEVLIYGYYRRDDGSYEAVICGDDLTVKMWEQAKASFEQHGGKRKNDLKPAKTVAALPKTPAGGPGKVVFVREDRSNNNVYCVYKGPDAASAKAFLDAHPVEKPLYYIVVETPEGTYARDRLGIYKE